MLSIGWSFAPSLTILIYVTYRIPIQLNYIEWSSLENCSCWGPKNGIEINFALKMDSLVLHVSKKILAFNSFHIIQIRER